MHTLNKCTLKSTFYLRRWKILNIYIKKWSKNFLRRILFCLIFSLKQVPMILGKELLYSWTFIGSRSNCLIILRKSHSVTTYSNLEALMSVFTIQIQLLRLNWVSCEIKENEQTIHEKKSIDIARRAFTSAKISKRGFWKVLVR